MSEWLSEKLTVFADMPEWLTAALLAYITAAITNVTSNAATATLFLPIVGSLVSTCNKFICSKFFKLFNKSIPTSRNLVIQPLQVVQVVQDCLLKNQYVYDFTYRGVKAKKV